jgi:molybdate/tungstate transport system substrate-binding protein
MRDWQRLAAVAALLGALLLSGCAPKEKISLKVFFAGSLITPFADVEEAYEAAHPNVDVLMEGHGSIQVIRHVTEIHQLIDVVVTADHALIPMLMYANTVPETGKPYSEWYIKFASNKLALAYSPRSKHADEITADNWYKIIARPGMKVGIPDPRFDAAGYRALMALKLAEAAYGKPTIFVDVILGQFRTAINAQEENGIEVIHVPEIVETKPDSNIVVRGSSIQLIALLESGDIDYAFEYESVIAQHGLQMVRLPDAVNLGVPEYAADYAKVQVRMDFQRFLSVNPVFNGEVIGYGVTIPTNAPNPKEAEEFVAFLLGPEGRKIMETNYHPFISPMEGNGYDAVPKGLQALCVPMQ